MKGRYIKWFSFLSCLVLFFAIEFNSRGIVFAQKTASVSSAQTVSGQSVSLEGTFIVMVADDFENQKATYSYYIQTKDTTLYELKDIENLKDFSRGDIIKVEGILISEGKEYIHNIITQGKAEIIQRYEPAKESLKEGPGPVNIRVAVILVNFRNDQSRPWTRQQIYDKYFSTTQNSVNTFYRENSYGKVQFVGDVFDNHGQYYTLNMDTPDCNGDGEILSRAIQTADPDIVFRNQNGQLYDEVVVAYPQRNCTFWIGKASGGRTYYLSTSEGDVYVGINWINGYINHLHVISHELGHNFGLEHANSWVCPHGRYIGEGCNQIEYGNPYDTMGANWGIGYNQTGHFQAIRKNFLGWISNNTVVDVTQTGIYHISALEQRNQSDPKALRMRSAGFLDYVIEYRKPTGFDSFMPRSGLLINRITATLLKLHSTEQPFILQVGEEFYDPDAGIYIQPLTENEDGMEVNIQFTHSPNIANLTATAEDSWPNTINLGQLVDLTYFTSNNSSRDITRPFREGFYVKSPYSSSWDLIQTKNISGLPAGHRQHDFFSWTAPTNLCGTFKFKVVTDDQDRILESSEIDNAAPNDNGHSMNVVCPGSDLMVTAHSWPARFNLGDNMSFGFTTTNQGTANTGGFVERYYVDNQEMGSRYIGNLGPSQGSTTGFHWRATCGVHKVEIKTDADNQVPETDELNNTTAPHKVWNNITVLCGPQNPVVASVFNEGNSALSNGKIVWQDNRNGNWDIYLYNLTTKTERPIVTLLSQQDFPSISGDNVIWSDTRNGSWDLYRYNLTTNLESRITASSSSASFSGMNIFGNKIVWSEFRLIPGSWDIFLFDLNSNQEQRITTNPYWQQIPDVGERVVTWEDHRHEIGYNQPAVYFYDLITQTEQPARLRSNAYQYTPHTSSNYIVWNEYFPPFVLVYLYNVANNELTQLNDSLGPVQMMAAPDIDGHLVAWIDKPRNQQDPYLHVYNIADRTKKDILLPNSQPIRLAINGNQIVWDDYYNGDGDIWVYDLTPIKITSPANGSSGGANVAITYEMNQGGTLKFCDNNRLVYTTGNGRGIYQYTFTGLSYGWHNLKVKIENSINPGEDTIRYNVRNRIETKPVISKRTLKPTPAKASVSSKKK